MKSKTIIIIAGPTAVGKTSLAIDLAEHFQTDIISADSRQCYTELNIGVAKPSPEQLSRVKHYFINSHSIHDEVNAAAFEQYALVAAGEIFDNSEVAVMVGGTGLYIKAFCEGLDEIPTVSPEIRSDIRSNYEEKGLPWLQERLQVFDPEYLSTGEMHNPQRLMRALEVRLGTGKSIRHFQQRQAVTRPFKVVKIGIDLPKEQLHNNIHQRVDDMISQGLLPEANALFSFRSLPALRTVGYTELFDHIEGLISLEHAIELIKKHTRHYAKRQLTWFRKDLAITWYNPNERERIIVHLKTGMK